MVLSLGRRRAHSILSPSDRDRMGNERLVDLFLGTSARLGQLKVRHQVQKRCKLSK